LDGFTTQAESTDFLAVAESCIVCPEFDGCCFNPNYREYEDTMFVDYYGNMCTVELEIDMSYTAISDLQIILVAPDNTEITIINRPGKVFNESRFYVSNFGQTIINGTNIITNPVRYCFADRGQNMWEFCNQNMGTNTDVPSLTVPTSDYSGVWRATESICEVEGANTNNPSFVSMESGVFGKNPFGTWRLKVRVHDDTGSGCISGWHLRVAGDLSYSSSSSSSFSSSSSSSLFECRNFCVASNISNSSSEYRSYIDSLESAPGDKKLIFWCNNQSLEVCASNNEIYEFFKRYGYFEQFFNFNLDNLFGDSTNNPVTFVPAACRASQNCQTCSGSEIECIQINIAWSTWCNTGQSSSYPIISDGAYSETSYCTNCNCHYDLNGNQYAYIRLNEAELTNANSLIGQLAQQQTNVLSLVGNCGSGDFELTEWPAAAIIEFISWVRLLYPNKFDQYTSASDCLIHLVTHILQDLKIFLVIL